MPRIKANGIDLYYEIEGPDDAPAVVLSHSIGTTSAMWDHQWVALSERFRCIRYDTRGHGRSEIVDAPFTIDDLADDLAALIETLGLESAHVVGLSLGGMIGQALAASRPERVDRLVLCCTAPNMPPASMWYERASTARQKGMAALSEAVIARWFTSAGRDGAEARRTKAMIEATDPIGYARCCEMIAAMDLRPVLSRIEAPALVVAGAEDPGAPPARGEEIRDAVPNARLVVMPDTAHLPSAEQPAELTALIADFLR